MDSFTPFSALAGGALIGLAASFYLLSLGRITGVSGVLANVLDRGAAAKDEAPSEARSSSLWFLGGLLLAGLFARLLAPSALAPSLPASTSGVALAAAAGLCVGVGTRLGAGCTSGHGVCGISGFRKRSIVATLTFMATGILTVAALRALGALS